MGTRCIAWVLVPLTSALGLVGACHQDVATIGFDLRFPQGVLDEIATLDLRVMETDGVTCDGSSGRVAGSAGGEVQDFALERGGCASGAVWCKTVKLPKDDSEKLFEVVGRDASGNERARGCKVETINQDPLTVDIQAFRVNPPVCCNDGVLQPGEQCDTMVAAPQDCQGNATNGAVCGGIIPDEVCECDCLAKEILASVLNTSAPMIGNAPMTKTAPQLAFSGSAAGNAAGSLRTVYVDSEAGVTGASDINIRMLSPELKTITTPITLAQQLRVTECNSIGSPTGIGNRQHEPALAKVTESFVGVVFASDFLMPNTFDIVVSAQGPSGCAEQRDVPVAVNREPTGPSVGSCEHPAIAGGPDNMGLIVWNQGNVLGRIWSPNQPNLPADTDANTTDDTFVPPRNVAATTVAMGVAPGARPRVAGNANGWVVAFPSGAGVSYARVDLGGAAQAPVPVSGTGEAPDIALLADGRFAITWAAGGAIFLQRHDAAGAAVAGDQDVPISVNSPPGSAPTIAGSTEAGGFFIVAWQADDGTVWSRIADASQGFRANSVTGQNGDYVASHPGIVSTRSTPHIAVSASFIAIGWASEGVDPYHGIHVRRFPFPGL